MGGTYSQSMETIDPAGEPHTDLTDIQCLEIRSEDGTWTSLMARRIPLQTGPVSDGLLLQCRRHYGNVDENGRFGS